ILDIRRQHDGSHLRIHLKQLVEHVQTHHAFHHQIQQDEIRLLQKVPLERGQAVLGLDDEVAGRLEDLARRAARQGRVVDQEDFRRHIRSSMASAIWSSLTSASLRPASTIDRGMPYTTQLASDSVSTVPPLALIQAEPSRPSDPIPVITMPSTRDP